MKGWAEQSDSVRAAPHLRNHRSELVRAPKRSRENKTGSKSDVQITLFWREARVGQTHLRSFFEQLREGRLSSFYLGLVFAEISSGSRFKVIAKICFRFIANLFGRGLPAVLGVPSVVIHT